MTELEPTLLLDAIAAGRWREATNLSRAWVHGTGPEQVLALDALWTAATAGRFGLTAQLGAVDAAALPEATSRADWAFAEQLGEAVGWRVDDRWCAWPDLCVPGFPTVALEGPAAAYPPGCFPFYDLFAYAPNAMPSPRDGFGEAPWNDWCDVWRVVAGGPAAG